MDLPTSPEEEVRDRHETGGADQCGDRGPHPFPAADLARISEGKPLSEEGAYFASIGRPRRPRPQPGDLLRVRPIADPGAFVHALTHPWSHPLAALMAAMMPAGGIPTHRISAGVNDVFAGGWPADPMGDT